MTSSEENTVSTTASYHVSGMTCAHCVKAVTEELDRLDAVTSVDIDLVPGGDSRVRVTSSRPLSLEQVRHAVDEAGYSLADPPT
ncbi:putative copper chaperone CopZ [Rhodococcus opacus RKJ300 = JCM 13270]|uniref:Putative copper chaperone CopZ n=2 Tax=Rhodococcus opacus TaxID=37919 RepID=C1BCY8_RHOOB|nr:MULTISPECIES: heavy-metal-associated domain-containing protein [Rhodococcus]EID81350.1 putative copper chaperone CopZ [Rhodococcus opacus RKJ300 = JCM 13270]QQZ19217.1 heavy-metal-associated domain-containing protein [Rhodococcus sp. 21391]UOT07989.1 heavy-metal-associated domain-containing protein [Rhodococcus opacus]BAH55732.1 putative copper chaperone CopZ [Rhodococcus opacus B4]